MIDLGRIVDGKVALLLSGVLAQSGALDVTLENPMSSVPLKPTLVSSR